MEYKKTVAKIKWQKNDFSPLYSPLLVSLSYVERDNKKWKQNMFPFDFFVIDHFVANFDQKMLEKRDIKKNIFSMALGRTYAWISILFSATDTFRIN